MVGNAHYIFLVVKKYLIEVLNSVLDPIRARREKLAQDPQAVFDLVLKGTQATLAVTQQTMQEVRHAVHLDYVK